MPVWLDCGVEEPKLQIFLLNGTHLPLNHQVSVSAANLPAMELNNCGQAAVHKSEQLAVQLRMQHEERVHQQSTDIIYGNLLERARASETDLTQGRNHQRNQGVVYA